MNRLQPSICSWGILLSSFLIITPFTSAGFTAVSAEGADFINLGGSEWHAKNSNGSIEIDAYVPGQIQLDLYNASIIPDLYYSNNYNYTQWISDDDWTYSRQLPAVAPSGKSWKDYKKTYLVFEGLDTAATVRLNGNQVGFANNQFRQWIFDVTDATTDNMTLEVHFESAIKYALAVFESTGNPYTVFTNYFWTYPEGREYIRKIQSDFGWDWGPHFAPAGIYRDAYLVGLDDAVYVTNTFIDVYKAGQRPNIPPDQTMPWTVNISVDYLSGASGLQPILGAELAGHNATSKNGTMTIPGTNTVELAFNISDGSVNRWWPNEFGHPYLYGVKLTLDAGMLASQNTSGTTSVGAEWTKKTGFRTIVLNLEPYTDRWGNNFHFEVNGKTFNAKGSNMVPVDAFEPRVDYAWYKRLIQSSIAANFNMIRLWASGNYYPDELYEISDELGIFLWSEFQFSDNYYPVFPEFLENVRHEVRYQMRRLNRHPCMAIWTGGNELEGYNLDELAYNTTYGESFFRNFTILHHDTIWPEVYRNTRSLSWIQSSDSHGYAYYNPDTGAYILHYGNLSEYPSPYLGPSENYNLVTDQAFNHSKIPAARFSVEFGAWSYDSLESYQTILPDDEIGPKAPVVIQRCYDDGPGMSSTFYFRTLLIVSPDTVNVLANAISEYYIIPNHTNPLHQFDQVSWTTQLYHADHMKNQIESYRRSISLPENNLGQLFWQLNAPWTTLSLNSIEYTGRWKVLQYVARQTFRRVAVSSWLEPTNTTFNLWVASDLWEPVTGTVNASWMTWSGDILNSTSYSFFLSALNSVEIDQRTGWGQILPVGGDTRNDILILKLGATSQSGQTYMNENFFVPKYVSNATVVDPGLVMSYVGNFTWQVTATKGVAAYVWVSTPGGVVGYFDDNAVFLVKGETRNFSFTVLEDSTGGSWTKGVSVRSIWDNYEIV